MNYGDFGLWVYVCGLFYGVVSKEGFFFFLGWFMQAVFFFKKENIWILCMVSLLIVESVCVNG